VVAIGVVAIRGTVATGTGESHENRKNADHRWPTVFSAVEVVICAIQLLRQRSRS
jgi:hypothetical protein